MTERTPEEEITLTELARAIFGADHYDSGRIFVNGEQRRFHAPADAIRAGLGFVTEDRKLQGLILNLTVRENVSLANLDGVSRFGLIQRRTEERIARDDRW